MDNDDDDVGKHADESQPSEFENRVKDQGGIEVSSPTYEYTSESHG